MNALIWGFNNNYQEIIHSLEKNKLINIKIWFCHNYLSNKYYDKQFDMSLFLEKDAFLTLYRNKFLQYTNDISYDQDVYRTVYKNLFRYINYESRQERYSVKPLSYYIDKFNLLYRFIYGVFIKEKIELCIFSNLTHEGMDSIIYYIAKAMNIKTILLFQSAIPNKYNKIFYLDNVDDFGNFSIMKKTYDTSSHKIIQTTTQDLFYMQGIKSNIYLDKLNSIAKKPNYSSKYICFFMHLQPELTTSCLGNMYCDQLLALEKLSKFVPNDCMIYVKENPKQTEVHRSNFFLQRMNLLDNVKLVPTNEDSHELIKNAKFVSTITGTVGWEALQQSKPVLIFGNTWYQNFEGCFKWNNEIKYSNIENYSINIEKLEKDYNNLLSKMPKAIIDPDYFQTIKDCNQEEYINNIYNLLKELIGNYQHT